MIPHQIITEFPRLAKSTIAVLVILDHEYFFNKGTLKISNSEIMNRIGITRKTLGNCLAELREFGINTEYNAQTQDRFITWSINTKSTTPLFYLLRRYLSETQARLTLGVYPEQHIIARHFIMMDRARTTEIKSFGAYFKKLLREQVSIDEFTQLAIDEYMQDTRRESMAIEFRNALKGGHTGSINLARMTLHLHLTKACELEKDEADQVIKGIEEEHNRGEATPIRRNSTKTAAKKPRKASQDRS